MEKFSLLYLTGLSIFLWYKLLTHTSEISKIIDPLPSGTIYMAIASTAGAAYYFYKVFIECD